MALLHASLQGIAHGFYLQIMLGIKRIVCVCPLQEVPEFSLTSVLSADGKAVRVEKANPKSDPAVELLYLCLPESWC